MISREEAKKCVGKGWSSLVDEAYDFIESNKFRVEVTKVKQKYGQLVITYDIPLLECEGESAELNIFTDDKVKMIEYVDERLAEIEDKSMLTCETCGEPGSIVVINDWIYAKCINHRDN
jgi:hypothetical protein